MTDLDRLFKRGHPRATQLLAVAELRLGDARLLADSGVRDRLAGAVYLGGFAVECWLKAALLARHPRLLGRVNRARLSPQDQNVHWLLYTSHDLTDLLAELPEVRVRLVSARRKGGGDLWPELQVVLEQWSVFARYSSLKLSAREAGRFVRTIEEAKPWLSQPM